MPNGTPGTRHPTTIHATSACGLKLLLVANNEGSLPGPGHISVVAVMALDL